MKWHITTPKGKFRFLPILPSHEVFIRKFAEDENIKPSDLIFKLVYMDWGQESSKDKTA